MPTCDTCRHRWRWDAPDSVKPTRFCTLAFWVHDLQERAPLVIRPGLRLPPRGGRLESGYGCDLWAVEPPAVPPPTDAEWARYNRSPIVERRHITGPG